MTKTNQRRWQHGRRPAFTLMEVTIVGALMAFLATLLSLTASGLCRPTADIAARCRVAQEANLAAASLVRDLAGSLANPEGRLGGKALYRFVGRIQPSNTQLWLCFDGGIAPNGIADWGSPDTVIVYELQANQLIRWDQNANTTHTVARNVESLVLQDLGDRVQIQLTFNYRNITQTYTFIARNP